jgi:hypothetical protein
MKRFGRYLGRAILIASVAGGLAAAPGALAAAGSNCDAYAKLTLQQAKRNVAMRCGYSGPRCEEVGPAGWRAELKVRDQMLARCRR